MINGIHLLLTYSCTFECDHCFLYCSPTAQGTFTIQQIREVLQELKKIPTAEWVYFEGGEPFLYYPLMLEGIKIANGLGFKSGIVSNTYWATTVEDAELWLKPLQTLGISELSLSDDLFHHDSEKDNAAKKAYTAAQKLKLPVGTICIEQPQPLTGTGDSREKGTPVIGGGVMFRGRAVDKISHDLPQRAWSEMNTCPHEELEKPQRVHLDSYGNVHICQGISMGNMWQVPLKQLVEGYNPDQHPICSPLIKGGPAELARMYQVDHDHTYVDECHFCYLVRKKLLNKFPDYLAPAQVYGIVEG